MKKPQALIGLLAALGTAIGVLVAVVGLPYGRLNYSAFAEVYHNGTNTTGLVSVVIDCDTATAGTQETCTYDPSALPAGMKVDITLGNLTAGPIIVSAFGATVQNPSAPKFAHIPVVGGPCAAPGFECNPDFNGDPGNNPTDTIPAPDVTGGYACSPLPGDTSGTPAVNNSSTIGCNDGAPVFTVPSSTAHTTLARVSYSFADVDSTTVGNQPSTAANGDSVTLSLTDVVVFDDSFSEVGSCNPVVTTAGFCGTAKIDFVIPPTNTPTATNTTGPTATFTPVPPTNTPTNTFTPVPPTNTPTNTPTATNTPAGARQVKFPEGNANNVLPNVPAANLWLCQVGPCAGPGEGDLRVVEKVSGVTTGDQNGDTVADGVGAYEFQVEYDNFVIQSVNPCDLVFGPGGAGSARGPVDELNSSSPANPDCTPDPNVNTNGTCSMSFVLENLVRFGCVTTGQVAGPNGSFDLASLDLIPHGDLSNDIFPGNNNGVLTVLKDNGCEVVDVFGHPVLGSVNGGLLPTCGDLAVTVRILEGDINLDCSVDITDAQTIATHYGGFFGSLIYSKWLDLEPATHDLDIDIKDLQKVFGRIGSTCQTPIPAQLPLDPPTPFG